MTYFGTIFHRLKKRNKRIGNIGKLSVRVMELI